MALHFVPRFRKKNTHSRKSFKLVLGVIFLLFFVLGIFKVFQNAPFFQIKEIVIKGVPETESALFLSTLHETMLEKKWSQILGKNHYFTWSEKANLNHPRFSTIAIVKKPLARIIEISALPKTRFGIWCVYPIINDEKFDSACWWIDTQTGAAYEKAFPAEGGIIIKIEEIRETPIQQDEKILPDLEFQYFSSIIKTLREIHVSVGEITLDHAHDEIIILSQGTKLRMSLRFNPKINLSALQTLLERKSIESYSSIDLTVPNKAYVIERI